MSMKNQVNIIINGVQFDAVQASGCTECAFFENCKDQCAALELPFDMVFKKFDYVPNKD